MRFVAISRRIALAALGVAVSVTPGVAAADDRSADAAALVRQARAHLRVLDYDQAAKVLLVLANDDSYPVSSHRLTAISLAAKLLHQDQKLKQAARLYRRVAAAKVPARRAAWALRRAMEVYDQMWAVPALKRTFKQYRRRFGKQPYASAAVVWGWSRLAQHARRQGHLRTARTYQLRVLSEFRRRGLAPGSPAAEYPARAAFQQAQARLKSLLATRPRSAVRRGKRRLVLGPLLRQAREVERDLQRVERYKRSAWTVAARCRSGMVHEHLARSIHAANPRNWELLRRKKRSTYESWRRYVRTHPDLRRLPPALEREVDARMELARKRYVSCLELARSTGQRAGHAGPAIRWLRRLTRDKAPCSLLLRPAKLELLL